ncbi:prepilin-type N-terminal cleavage/methylation domain-containing protein [Sphaerotilus hippei]|uniref:Prepilin-type N-terminal cleavage/methylation domain-containing protein n=1 Tax=Sphaerotilus hippei TaxID=744406 RepID=A0A318H3H9_9BURK|nr:prepilin-type N-terminal cleavage/methylation domain-containing protein [Sphaerotilus hippei]PXW96262.1 prepilin-type N-terminal cleavage/methylation domain-containing protein [Sphaerotilus hippei]
MLSRTRGFSLIELLVTLSVAALILVAAAPQMTAWMANARVRNMAEQLINGIRLAQSVAMQRGRQAAFVLTSAAPAVSATPVANGPNWYVQTLPLLTGETVSDATAFVQGSTISTGSRASLTGPAVVCFNSIGRQVSNTSTGLGSNCSAAAQTYDVTATGGTLRLRITITTGGQVRLCNRDKTLSSTVPDGC